MVHTRSGRGGEQPPRGVRGRGQDPVKGRGRSQDRPREVEKDDLPPRPASCDSSSAPRWVAEESHLHDSMHESPSVAPVSVHSEQAQASVPRLQELIGIITQAVTTAITSVPSPQSQSLDRERSYERARKLGATEFSGTTNPLEAEVWFQKIEKVFTLMKSPDDQKLGIATFLLEGQAQHWWRSYVDRQPRSAVISWNDFRREFFQQYYSVVYQDQKRKEFLSLTQGRMTVAEYEAKFTELSRFAPAFVADEKERCRLFQDGLHLGIKAKTKMHNYGDFADLVTGAMRAEEIENEYISRKQERGKRGAPSSFGGPVGGQVAKKASTTGRPIQTFRPPVESSMDSHTIVGPAQGRIERRTVSQSAGSKVTGGREDYGTMHRGSNPSTVPVSHMPPCGRCGKFHLGECRKGQKGCYQCGQEGHQKKNCPANIHAKGFPSRPSMPRGFSVGSGSYVPETQAAPVGTSASR